jgi:hypothetical protein
LSQTLPLTAERAERAEEPFYSPEFKAMAAGEDRDGDGWSDRGAGTGEQTILG